jgi:hypothetical protein
MTSVGVCPSSADRSLDGRQTLLRHTPIDDGRHTDTYVHTFTSLVFCCCGRCNDGRTTESVDPLSSLSLSLHLERHTMKCPTSKRVLWIWILATCASSWCWWGPPPAVAWVGRRPVPRSLHPRRGSILPADEHEFHIHTDAASPPPPPPNDEARDAAATSAASLSSLASSGPRPTFFLHDEGFSLQDQVEIFQQRFRRETPRFFAPDQTRETPVVEPSGRPSPPRPHLKRYHPPSAVEKARATIPDGVTNYDALAASGLTLSQAASDATPMAPDDPLSRRSPTDDPPSRRRPNKKIVLHQPPTPTKPSAAARDQVTASVAPPLSPPSSSSSSSSSKTCPIPPAFTDMAAVAAAAVASQKPGPVLGPVRDDTPPGNVIVIPPPPGSTVGGNTSAAGPKPYPLQQRGGDSPTTGRHAPQPMESSPATPPPTQPVVGPPPPPPATRTHRKPHEDRPDARTAQNPPRVVPETSPSVRASFTNKISSAVAPPITTHGQADERTVTTTTTNDADLLAGPTQPQGTKLTENVQERLAQPTTKPVEFTDSVDVVTEKQEAALDDSETVMYLADELMLNDMTINDNDESIISPREETRRPPAEQESDSWNVVDTSVESSSNANGNELRTNLESSIENKTERWMATSQEVPDATEPEESKAGKVSLEAEVKCAEHENEQAMRKAYFAKRIEESRKRALMASLAMRKKHQQNSESSDFSPRFNPNASSTTPTSSGANSTDFTEVQHTAVQEEDPQELQ